MKMYVRPEILFIKLRAEEGIACFGSGDDHPKHGGGNNGKHNDGKNHGKNPGGGRNGGWGWFFPW